jgi:capsular exopolysaccharide synthesis family protein
MIHSSSTHGEQEGIPRLISIIRERRRAILLCMVASFATAAVGYARSPTRYTSEAILALDVRKLQALPTESVVSPLPQESPVLRTELDIIGSQSMAERVLASLQNGNPGSGPQSKYNRPRDTGMLSRGDAQTSKMVKELMTNVRVMNDGRSYTIYIAYSAGDPAYAAKVANAFGEAYIDYQIDLQTTATRRVSDWLGERLVNLRTKLEESERQAQEFREKSGLVDTGGIPLLSQRLSGLNTELTMLQTKLAGANARLATALEVQRSGDGLGLTEVLSSPAIQLLRAEQARVVRAIGEIDESGARMNPQLPQLQSQLASLRRQVGQEISQIVASLRNEIEVNDKQQREVETNFNTVQRAITDTNTAVVQSAQLDREAAANRSIYETYLARYKQTIEQDGIATAEARIISRAMPSTRPASPDKSLWVLMAIILGCGTGLGVALILHMTDGSVGSITALQQKTGLAVIGKIPRIPAAEFRNSPEMFSGGAADFYSAFADLQTYIQLEQDKARVIAFTSSTDREGKTFVVANLARSLALSGVKLIVIDANLRNPALGMEFEVLSSRHLARAIAQEITFDELIQRDESCSLDVIVAQADESPPNLVLGNKRFATLMSELRQRYELVLIDAPSVSYDLDLLRIATFSDTTVLVVRQEIANSIGIQNAVMKLHTAGKHITGMVLNGVRRQKRRHRFHWLRVFRKSTARRSTALPHPSLARQSVS